jgi:hypothetical protein
MSVRAAAFSTLRAAPLVALAATLVTLDSAVAQETARIMGINGSWERYPSLAPGLGSDTEHDPPPPPAPIADPPLKPEYLGEWRAARERERELTQQGLPPVNSGSACLPQGMPGMMMGMFPMEVLETPGQVTFIQEAYNQVRRVYLDEELIAAEDAEPRFSGHSVGHWEGDTLVMETVGVKEYARFQGAPHSMNMRIVERLRLIDENYMENVVTVTDPEYLTGPWTWTFMYRRWPGYKIQEYVCEDNRYYEDPELGYQRLRIGEAE